VEALAATAALPQPEQWQRERQALAAVPKSVVAVAVERSPQVAGVAGQSVLEASEEWEASPALAEGQPSQEQTMRPVSFRLGAQREQDERAWLRVLPAVY